MPRYCQNCGSQLGLDDQFCGECGKRVPGRAAPDGREHSGENHDMEPPGGPSPEQDRPEVQGYRHESSSNAQPRDGSQRTQQTPRGENYGEYDPQNDGADSNATATKRRTGRGGQHPTREDLTRPPRKNAIDTFSEGVSWLMTLPVLFAAFLGIEILNVIGQELFGLLSLASAILGLIVWGTAYLYAERFVSEGPIAGTTDEFLELASEAADRLVSLIGIGIVYFIAVVIGLLLLVLPGIYLGARLILAFPACVIDKQSASDSLSTSWDITEGNILKLVGIFIINLLGAIGVGAFAGAIGGLAFGLGFIDTPVFALITAPVIAFLAAAVNLAVGRVYLENRRIRRSANVTQQSRGG